MEVSPTRQAQVAECEKLRDTVTGISALHLSLHDGRLPSPQNSFKELYRMSTQAMIKRKEEMVSELKTLPPCSRNDCNEHKIPTTSVVEEINFFLKVPPPELTNSKGNKNKKLCKKRKNKGKESTEEFIFPKKTARPVSPTSTQYPIVTSNNFSDLEHRMLNIHSRLQINAAVDPPCRDDARKKTVEAKTSFHWSGVEVRRGVPAQVSSSSHGHGSKITTYVINSPHAAL
ncbi:hypothetical protein TNCV_3072011 [Trichonephila clavipes]|nr:hypothetical protein TNCV_3072011 [Trichonephila clavipes]